MPVKRSENSRVLSSFHKQRKKLIANPYTKITSSLDARAITLHNVLAEMRMRRQRLLMLAEMSKNSRKAKLEDQAKKVEEALVPLSKEYELLSDEVLKEHQRNRNK